MNGLRSSIERALESLKDVDGVLGAALWSRDGELLVRSLPRYVDDDVLTDIGPRIHRIYEAFQSSSGDVDNATLMFEDHKLHLRQLPDAFVVMVSTVSVNIPALRMAWNLVSRRLLAVLTAQDAQAQDVADDDSVVVDIED